MTPAREAHRAQGSGTAPTKGQPFCQRHHLPYRPMRPSALDRLSPPPT